MATFVIFSDLDGTVLDEETHSLELSASALQQLQTLGATIILCSSKTRQEQEDIRAMLGLKGPFIIENGSAIVIPADTISVFDGSEDNNGTKVLVLGKSIADVLSLLNKVRSTTGFAFEGFHDLSAVAVSHVTGLNLEAAKRAQAREYSETIVTKFTQMQLSLFSQVCNTFNLHCISGGRFLNVVGSGVDKGVAVSLLINQFEWQFGDVVTAGVGDSENDEAMLQVVDYPFLVQRPSGDWETLRVDRLYKVPAIGPYGFKIFAEKIAKKWFVNQGSE